MSVTSCNFPSMVTQGACYDESSWFCSHEEVNRYKLTDDIPLDILFTNSYCDYLLSEEDYVSTFDGIS